MVASCLTVRSAFERFHLPVLIADRSASSTITTYRSTIRRWEKYGEPALAASEIRQSNLLAFRTRLIDAGYSPTTFDGSWRNIRAIIGTLVVEELAERIPKTPRIKATRACRKSRPTPEEFDRLIKACGVAEWPRRFRGRRPRIAPPVIWRSLYRVAFLTALRRGDLCRLSKSHVHGDGLRVIAQKTRRSGKLIFCPEVHGALSASLEPLMGWDADRIFPISLSRGLEIGQTMAAIAKEAGLPEEKATLQPLRRASIDAWTMASVNAPGLIGGHGLKAFLPAITREAYVGDQTEQQKVEQLLKEAAEKFRLPNSFELVGKES